MDEITVDLEAAKSEPLVVPVDQYFNVKGIGLVAIGYVQSGSVAVHDELVLLPSDGPGTVKIYRLWMDDVPEAVAGDRVGIALRNTKEEHLTGGSLIIHPALEDKIRASQSLFVSDKHNSSMVNINISPFQKNTCTWRHSPC